VTTCGQHRPRHDNGTRGTRPQATLMIMEIWPLARGQISMITTNGGSVRNGRGGQELLPDPRLTTSTVIRPMGLAHTSVWYLMRTGAVWFGG